MTSENEPTHKKDKPRKLLGIFRVSLALVVHEQVASLPLACDCLDATSRQLAGVVSASQKTCDSSSLVGAAAPVPGSVAAFLFFPGLMTALLFHCTVWKPCPFCAVVRLSTLACPCLIMLGRRFLLLLFPAFASHYLLPGLGPSAVRSPEP